MSSSLRDDDSPKEASMHSMHSIHSGDSNRVRMVVEENSSSMTQKYVKEGSFVIDMEQKDFDIAAIRNSRVPEDVGSAVPLDESLHSFSSRSDMKCNEDSDDSDDDYGDKEEEEDDDYYHKSEMKLDESKTKDDSFEREERRKQCDGVLFSRNDLENYDKYHRETSTSRCKNFATYGISTLFAVGLSIVLGVVLIGKVKQSDGLPGAQNPNLNQQSLTEDNWWLSAEVNTDADVQDSSTIATFIQDDPDGATSMNYKPIKPPPSNGDSPRELAALAPLSEPFDFDRDIPFLWMIPRTASLQVRDTIGHCFQHHFSRQYNGPNTGTDTIFSHLLYKVSNSFNRYYPQTRGRMFTMLRDPMERTIDMWLSHREEEGHIALNDYLKSHFDNNWMTRFLTNNFDAKLTNEDLEKAKTILREKSLIGLHSQKEKSLDRFIHYFQWDTLNLETQRCITVVMHAPGYEHPKIPFPNEFSPEYELLQSRNHMDTPLYEYAKELYEEQKKELFSDLV